MAKKPGLPPGFDLEVSKTELVGKPARLPGYLERMENAQHVTPQIVEQEEKVVKSETPVASPPPTRIAERKIQPSREVRESSVPKQLPSRSGKRAQINLPNEIKVKLMEMARQFSAQTNGQEINRSDVVVGLILALYEARDLVNMGALPVRGKWGTSTAKSIGPALSLAFQEALEEYSRRAGGGDPFKKVVGG